MGDTDRLNEECRSIGFEFTRWSDGRPVIPNLSEADKAKISALLAAHVVDDKTYINTNLEADSAALALKALITTQQWANYKLRQIAVSDTLQDEAFFSLTKAFLKLVYVVGEAGGSLTAANVKSWRDKVKAVLGL